MITPATIPPIIAEERLLLGSFDGFVLIGALVGICITGVITLSMKFDNTWFMLVDISSKPFELDICNLREPAFMEHTHVVLVAEYLTGVHKGSLT